MVQRTIGNDIQHVYGMCMMQRLVTVCLGLLVLVWHGQAAAPSE